MMFQAACISQSAGQGGRTLFPHPQQC